MSYFIEAVNRVINIEGPYSDDPDDSGGATNWGITLADFREFNKNPSLTKEDLKELTPEGAMPIYESMYWNPLNLDDCTNEVACLAIFDQAVNRGIKTAVEQAQRILGVTADGSIGPQTLRALNAYNPTQFIIKFVCLSQQSYVQIVLNNHTQLSFLKGWINRTQGLLNLIS